MVFSAVMAEARRFGFTRSADFQLVVAIAPAELDVFFCCHEFGCAEMLGQLHGDKRRRLGGCIVFDDIARLVVVGEAELEGALHKDGTNIDGFEIACRGGRFGERERNEASPHHCGGEGIEHFGNGWALTHGAVIGRESAAGKPSDSLQALLYTGPMTAEIHLVYGQLPRGLVEVTARARQCSPLTPGSLALEACAAESVASAIMYAPPGTIERRYVLALCLQAMRVGGALTVLAPKDKGGSRIAAELAGFGCTVTENSRSHHKIVHTVRPERLDGVETAIAQGGMRQYPRDGLWTQPGVFSWDRLDAGSALLLNHLPALAGHGADLGCGIGVLSQAILRSPTVGELVLVDIDRRAVAAAQKNIADPRARFLWADMRDAPLPASGLDFVVMNPPFHDAGIEDQGLGQLFIERAAVMLTAGGKLWLVANRHLPYEALLARAFAHVTAVAEADGFKIYSAEK